MFEKIPTKPTVDLIVYGFFNRSVLGQLFIILGTILTIVVDNYHLPNRQVSGLDDYKEA